MKRKRFAEEQIITVLKQNEAGSTVVDLARHHGVAEDTIYRWRSKYGGMEVSDATLRTLEAENSKPRLLYADAMLDNNVPKDSALVEAGSKAMRPIAMTTLAAILALLPLGLALGQGSALQ